MERRGRGGEGARCEFVRVYAIEGERPGEGEGNGGGERERKGEGGGEGKEEADGAAAKCQTS